MTLFNGIDVPTPAGDKAIAARESKPGAFVDLLARIGTKGWRFCIVDRHGDYSPVADTVLMRLLPNPPDGGSDDLGQWLDGLEDLTLCYHRASNADEVLATMAATEAGRREMRDAFWSPTLHPDYWPEGWYTVSARIETIIADYYGVDMRAVAREQDAILKAIRKFTPVA